MMMPANYSAIAENEMTYVVGGASVLEGLQKLGQNTWTIIGNTYVSKLVGATLGTMFSGNYKFGGVWNALGDIVTGGLKPNSTTEYVHDFLNGAMQVVGLGAATHQLATVDVKNETASKEFIKFQIK